MALILVRLLADDAIPAELQEQRCSDSPRWTSANDAMLVIVLALAVDKVGMREAVMELVGMMVALERREDVERRESSSSGIGCAVERTTEKQEMER